MDHDVRNLQMMSLLRVLDIMQPERTDSKETNENIGNTCSRSSHCRCEIKFAEAKMLEQEVDLVSVHPRNRTEHDHKDTAHQRVPLTRSIQQEFCLAVPEVEHLAVDSIGVSCS